MESQMRILIVDDEPDMCWVLENALRSEGYQILGATSGREALELFREALPNIALIDLSLPDMTGIQLATLMREMCSDVIILAISTHLCEENSAIEREMEFNGFAGFISKPFDLTEVRLAVKMAVNQLKSPTT